MPETKEEQNRREREYAAAMYSVKEIKEMIEKQDARLSKLKDEEQKSLDFWKDVLTTKLERY